MVTTWMVRTVTLAQDPSRRYKPEISAKSEMNCKLAVDSLIIQPALRMSFISKTAAEVLVS
jgi:hypothetical protein